MILNAAETPWRIIGIDPGLRVTGYAVLECHVAKLGPPERNLASPPQATPTQAASIQATPTQATPTQVAPTQAASTAVTSAQGSAAARALATSTSGPGRPVAALALTGLTKHRIRIVEAGVIRVAAGRGLEWRLKELKGSLDEILRERQPQLMAVEQLYAHYERSQPAILMGHARGVIMLAAAEQGLPVVSYSATSVKKTVSGHGRAPKGQIQAAVCHHLGLAKVPEPHDVADALAIALCHLFVRQFS
jgi:crossover junction endodeoxyribonuclease RuvC